MKSFRPVIASFVVMLCLGGVYAWSLFVPELRQQYGFSSTQAQSIFGVLIAVFPVTMILAGQLEQRLGMANSVRIAALLFAAGYGLAALSQGNFVLCLLGIGVLGGMATGFGYLAAITLPALCFPERKGLMTGIAAAGFGLAAVVLSLLAEILLEQGVSVLKLFALMAIMYGALLGLASFWMHNPVRETEPEPFHLRQLFGDRVFFRLVCGIFCGTFAGLLVIGNLKPIGALSGITPAALAAGISLFALSNFAGRLFWGGLSDHWGAIPGIIAALSMQALGIFLLGHAALETWSYLLFSMLIGFGFGANFVLFARETAQSYGARHVGRVYPYVFLGYALAGILGPLAGGVIYDHFNEFAPAAYLATVMSLLGAALFLFPSSGWRAWRQKISAF